MPSLLTAKRGQIKRSADCNLHAISMAWADKEGATSTNTQIGLGIRGGALYLRLMRLVEAMEAEGYLIAASRDGNSYYIREPIGDGIRSLICSKVRFSMALAEDPDLRAALQPFLARHRPYAWMAERIRQEDGQDSPERD